jgi:hypothetical protein
MARLRANRLDFAAAKGMSAVSKDADMSPFNACSRLFEAPRQGDTANPPRCVIIDYCFWGIDPLTFVLLPCGLLCAVHNECSATLC